jgi:hypothetical protein
VESGREAELRSVQASAELARVKAELVQAQAAEAGAFARLTAFVGSRTPFDSITSSMLSREPRASAAGGADAPSVAVAQAESRAASARVSVEERRWIPDVTISGNQRYVMVAAGTVKIKDKETDPEPAGVVTFNGLSAWASANGEVSLKFAGANDASLRYVAKALPVASAGLTDATVSFGAAAAAGAPRLTLMVKNAGVAVPRAQLVGQQLMLEISAFGPG